MRGSRAAGLEQAAQLPAQFAGNRPSQRHDAIEPACGSCLRRELGITGEKSKFIAGRKIEYPIPDGDANAGSFACGRPKASQGKILQGKFGIGIIRALHPTAALRVVREIDGSILRKMGPVVHSISR